MKFKVTDDKQFLQLIDGTKEEIEQLDISFTRKIENAKWRSRNHPYWNGDVHFFDKKLRIPFGLWDKVQDVCKRYNYKLEIDGMDKVIDFNFDEDEYRKWEKEFFKNSNKKPREFQTKAVIEILKWRRSMSELATSSGKTQIIFCVFAFLKQKGLLNKMLIIVPSVNLITQGIEDFEEFSQNKTLIKYKIQAIGGGRPKIKQNVDIVIGTFHTLKNLDKSFFENINVVAVDECHQTKTKSVQTVLSKVKADLRFGVSGTTGVTGNKAKYADAYTIQSLLGPLITKVTPDFIINKGYATPVNVRILYLDYLNDETKEMLYKLRSRGNNDGSKILKLERDLIIENTIRFEFIVNLISRSTKNSIVFFTDIKNSYGKRIYNRLKQRYGDKFKVMYIDGSTKTELRDEYKKLMDLDKDPRIKILIASFGTFSTGISINNVHNIFLCESYKSERIIKQTIGRGMRLHKNKTVLNIIDIVDDFTFKGYKNYMVNHAIEREQIYLTEKFKYEKFKIKLL